MFVIEFFFLLSERGGWKSVCSDRSKLGHWKRNSQENIQDSSDFTHYIVVNVYCIFLYFKCILAVGNSYFVIIV